MLDCFLLRHTNVQQRNKVVIESQLLPVHRPHYPVPHLTPAPSHRRRNRKKAILRPDLALGGHLGTTRIGPSAGAAPPRAVGAATPVPPALEHPAIDVAWEGVVIALLGNCIALIAVHTRAGAGLALAPVGHACTLCEGPVALGDEAAVVRLGYSVGFSVSCSCSVGLGLWRWGGGGEQRQGKDEEEFSAHICCVDKSS